LLPDMFKDLWTASIPRRPTAGLMLSWAIFRVCGLCTTWQVETAVLSWLHQMIFPV